MPIEKIEVLVVGGGQAGLAMSRHLSEYAIPHLVLERYRIAERWRSERWDSLVANGPAWHDRFPDLEFSGVDLDGFPSKEQVADYFVAYAQQIAAPIRCDVEVTSVRRNSARPGFRAETSSGPIEARFVVAATGPFQRPVIPPIAPQDSTVQLQIHSSAYRNPEQLPAGDVLVIGAGSSGVQIASELQQSGRHVYLSIGPHGRPPRRYRGRDYVWWLGVLGRWDAVAPPSGAEHVTIAVSGAGGTTVDFRALAATGITLVGRTTSFEHGKVQFAPDLAKNIANGDLDYLSLLDAADAYIALHGLDLPDEPHARVLGPNPRCVTDPLLELNLTSAGVTSIIWATGYTVDFDWLHVDAFDENGNPKHHRGVSSERGVYFLGLPWLSQRGSSFIWGVWHDARYLADHIAIQRNYLAYRNTGRAATANVPKNT